MRDLVFAKDGQAVTTSVAIAEGTGNEHASVILLVRKHLVTLEQFGRVRFEIAPFQTTGGRQSREVAELNEHQATLLLTMMRNTDVVLEFKVSLVKAFFAMAQQLAMQKFNVPQTYPDAMRLAADLAEQVSQQKAELALAAPKAAALDRLSGAEGSLPVADAAKTLGIKPADLFGLLNYDLQAIYRRNGKGAWIAHQWAIDKGYLIHRLAVVARREHKAVRVHNTLRGLRTRMPEVVETQAERIRYARIAAKMSQQELAAEVAARTGLPMVKSMVSKWELGAVKNPRGPNMVAIAEATGFTYQWLVCGGPEPVEMPDQEAGDVMLQHVHVTPLGMTWLAGQMEAHRGSVALEREG